MSKGGENASHEKWSKRVRWKWKNCNWIEIATEINRIQFKCAVVVLPRKSTLGWCVDCVYWNNSSSNKRENFQLKCDIFDKTLHWLNLKNLSKMYGLGNCLMIYFLLLFFQMEKAVENSTRLWEYMKPNTRKTILSECAMAYVSTHFTQRCSLISSIRFEG